MQTFTFITSLLCVLAWVAAGLAIFFETTLRYKDLEADRDRLFEENKELRLRMTTQEFRHRATRVSNDYGQISP